MDFFILWNLFLGALYPTSMRINEQGRLVVNFRTEARFRGLFVTAHSGVLLHILNILQVGTFIISSGSNNCFSFAFLAHSFMRAILELDETHKKL